MAERAVYRSRLDADGDVVAVVSVTARWSPRSSHEVIDDVDAGRCHYVVDWETGTVPVVVIDGPDGRRLDAAGPDGVPGGLALLPPG